MKRIDLIIDALIAFDVMAHEQKIPVYIDEAHKALAAARELKALKPEPHTTLHDVCQEVLRLEQANADMLSALRAIVAVAETEDSFSMQTIKDCANIAIKQATGEQA